jgi:hypothetical protein
MGAPPDWSIELAADANLSRGQKPDFEHFRWISRLTIRPRQASRKLAV